MEISKVARYNKFNLESEMSTHPQNYQSAIWLFENEDTFRNSFTKFEMSTDRKIINGVKLMLKDIGRDISKHIVGEGEIEGLAKFLEQAANIVKKSIK